MDDSRKRRGSEEQSGRERRHHKRDNRVSDRRALVTKAITAAVVVTAAVASALVLIDNSKRRSPDMFDPNTITRSVGHNWAQKFTNLKRLLFHVEIFYRGSLGRNSDFSKSIDLAGVARNASPAGVRALVQVLVGASVSSSNKARHIKAIMLVNTFELSTPCSALSDLSDGVTMSQVLLEISPDMFDPNTITRSVGHNWAQKFTNLKRLLFHVEIFYRGSLGRNSDFSKSIDLAGVARNASPAGIRALVQVLVGAAVSSSNKARHIQAVMLMSEPGQKAVQKMVEESMKGMEAEGEWEDGGTGGVDEEWTLRLVEEWTLRLEEAETSMASLAKERDEEASTRRALEKSVNDLKGEMREMEVYALARDQNAKGMGASIAHLEESLEVCGGRLEEALRETRALRLKLDQEIKSGMDKDVELRRLEDAVDIAKAKAIQLTKMETTLEKYKARWEEMEDLRQQNKQLDEVNNRYLEQLLELEKNGKIIPSLKGTIKKYKHQAAELELQNFEATSAVAVKDTEVQKLREELEAATEARMFFEDELTFLRNENKAHAEALEEDLSMASQGGLFEGATNRAEVEEQVSRQNQEIARLKSPMAEEGMEGGKGTSRVEVLETMKTPTPTPMATSSGIATS